MALPARGHLSLVQRRVLRAHIEIESQDASQVLYQHTVLCQTVMPYRNPGEDARLWHRVQGNAHLEMRFVIVAGKGPNMIKRVEDHDGCELNLVIKIASQQVGAVVAVEPARRDSR